MVHIDFEQLGNLAHTGVRRAVLFMGLGLNAAHRKEFRDYQLHKLPILPGQTGLPIEFFPDNLPAERVDEFKSEFATWITGCGLRELTEHYAIMLDQIHHGALAVYQERKKLDSIGDPAKVHQKFHRFGVPAKLKSLSESFGVKTKHAESVSSLYEARNCLTHDFGNVTTKRVNHGDTLVLTWLALDMLAQGVETGQEIPLAHLIGQPTPEETNILMRSSERHRVLKVGEKLKLSQQDLWEICYFFNAHAIPSILSSFGDFLKVHGVPNTGAHSS
ncbi:MAG: hypothetical protein AB7S70_02950 [Hyphomicrobium sp.]|uniref:hypothetical protein n=1 Tax=Hyphomicrobium sp. TaxID=82 RepID=UPI003D1511FA